MLLPSSRIWDSGCCVQSKPVLERLFLKILDFYVRNMKLDFCSCLCVMHATSPGERHHAFTEIILLSDFPKAHHLTECHLGHSSHSDSLNTIALRHCSLCAPGERELSCSWAVIASVDVCCDQLVTGNVCFLCVGIKSHGPCRVTYSIQH